MEVILVTYQSAHVVRPLLSVLKNIPVVQICVVDNGSRDNTLEQVRPFANRLMEQSVNLGFARAANLAAQTSREDVLCFLNPDCMVSEEVMQAGEQSVSSASRPTIAVPFLQQPDGTIPGKQPGYTRRKLLADILETNRRARRVVARLKASKHYHDSRWYWPLGTCLFVRRDDFMRIGGFAEDFFMYMEDVDFGKRFWQADGTIVQMQETVLHRAGRGASVDIPHRLGLLNRARLQYARACYGPLFALLVEVCLTGCPFDKRVVP